jgi:hypothetical protein
MKWNETYSLLTTAYIFINDLDFELLFEHDKRMALIY